jgi:aminopeptidase N
MKQILLTTIYWLLATCLQAQLSVPKQTFTKADTLRGSNNENRNWWDVLRYDITVKPDFEKKEIKGVCKITFRVTKDVIESMSPEGEFAFIQIDLQKGMYIDRVLLSKGGVSNLNQRIKDYKGEETESWMCNILTGSLILKNQIDTLEILFHGKPHEAKKAPWDGGWVWAKDKLGRPFVSVACQGLGASCWFPCKDYQGDEPDYGASLTMIVPDSLVAISNGVSSSSFLVDAVSRFSTINYNKEKKTRNEQRETNNEKQETRNQKHYTWQVTNPINTYCIVPYIGNYVNFTDTFIGEKGTLDLSFWVLDYNKERAQEQFKQVKPMLRAFEYWFGAYPFYEDGYKLVEAPYLGMEHQSAIAYGNDYKQGYKGRDLSGSGWGLKWDFIIVHESGHEWFANSITTNDIADMWVHEGFTNYSEVLFTEYYYGKEAANDYCYGLRKNIKNDESVIGTYGVNKEGSGDMYWKACNMIHSIRNALNDDEKFRQILRGMNSTFYHKTIDGGEIEQYLIEQTGLDLQKTFEQYLTTTQIPTLEYYFKGRKLFYKYSNCIDGFNMPINIPIKNKTIVPTTQWQQKRLRRKNKEWFTDKNVERMYLLKVKKIENETK